MKNKLLHIYDKFCSHCFNNHVDYDDHEIITQSPTINPHDSFNVFDIIDQNDVDFMAKIIHHPMIFAQRGEFGITPLMYACQVQKHEMAKMLMQFDINATTLVDPKETALSISCVGGDVGIVKMLLENGANLKDSIPDIILRFDEINIDIIKLLVEFGFDINSTNHIGQNMLMQDVELNRCFDRMMALIEIGADIYHIDNDGHNILFVILSFFQSHNYVDVVRMIDYMMKQKVDKYKVNDVGHSLCDVIQTNIDCNDGKLKKYNEAVLAMLDMSLK